MIKTVRTALAGLGAVNRGWLNLLSARRAALRDRGIDYQVVAVADSSGVAIRTEGFEPHELLDLKSSGGNVRQLTGFLAGVRTEEMTDHTPVALLIESTAGNLRTGQPGLALVKSALKKNCGVVLANKAPLVLAFDELIHLCDLHGGRLAYSATVCGGLPVVNVLQRDLKLARIKAIRGVFNATSNFVLRELERGGTLEDAVKEAQRLGAAEADPTHDLHGHDTANKLFIILKSATDFSGQIADIRTTGIQEVSYRDLQEAKGRGRTIKLVAEAIPGEASWQLSVSPVEIPRGSFLGSCEGWEMGVEIETDLYEKICMKNYEADPLGTSAAVMRDCLDIS